VAANFDFTGSIAILLIGFVLLWIVRRIFGRYIGSDTKEKFHTDTVGKILELLIIAGIAYGLMPVPIVSSSVGLLQKFVTSASAGWQNNISIGGSVLLLLILTGLGIFKYWKSDNEWWTVLFAVSILALSAPIPDLANIMQAVLVGPITWLWNFLIGILHAIENIRFG
jgi:predicted transporter